jgi:hypothetical protein
VLPLAAALEVIKHVSFCWISRPSMHAPRHGPPLTERPVFSGRLKVSRATWPVNKPRSRASIQQSKPIFASTSINNTADLGSVLEKCVSLKKHHQIHGRSFIQLNSSLKTNDP